MRVVLLGRWRRRPPQHQQSFRGNHCAPASSDSARVPMRRCTAYAGSQSLVELTASIAGIALVRDFGGIPLNDAARAGLAMTSMGSEDLVAYDELFIYTDGSFSDACAEATTGWAFVVLGRVGMQIEVVGVLFHPGPGSGLVFSEIPELDNNDMEAAAVLWAALWLLVVRPAVPVTVVSDSALAEHVAQSLWYWRARPGVAQVLSSVCQVAEQVVQLHWEHIQSHCGHPWNELADSLAKWAALGHGCFLPDALCDRMQASNSLNWEWLRAAPAEFRAAYPPIVGTDFVFTELRSEAALTPPRGSAEGGGGSRPGMSAGFGVVSYNVRTFKSGDNPGAVEPAELPAPPLPGRAAALRRQFRDLGVAIVGFQESRTAAESYQVDGFLVIASGAIKGNLGCELWVDLRAPLVKQDGRGLCVPASACVVVHADPRLLVVCIRCQALSCTVAVAHAPHSSHPLEERDRWWQQLTSVLLPYRDVLLAVDANARLGTVHSAAVSGGGFTQEQDSNGGFFHRTLLELDLCAPTTFGTPHLGGYTWVHSSGAQHRLDYVCVPQDWLASVVPEPPLAYGAAASEPVVAYGRVLFQVDALAPAEDHFPVLLRFEVPQESRGELQQWRGLRIDTRKLQDPSAVKSFRERLQAIPPVPWHVPLDAHERAASSAVCEAATASFARDKGGKKRAYLSDQAFAVVRLRRRARAWLRALKEVRHGRSRGLELPTPGAVWQWAVEAMPTYPDLSGSLWVVAFRLGDICMHGEGLELNGLLEQLADILGGFVGATSSYLRCLVRRDGAAYLDGVAGSISLEAAGADAARAWAGVRVLLARGGAARFRRGRQLPRRVAPDGTVATTREEIAAVIIDHFAGIEGAVVQDWATLAAGRNAARPPVSLDFGRDVANLQSISGLRLSLAHAQARKAGGVDDILDDFSRAAPAEMAMIYHPLHTKMALQCQEPLVLKGGVAHDLYKGSGAAEQMNFYRSVLLQSTVAKHHHRFLRSRLMSFLGAAFMASQCGGVPGKGTSMAALLVRSFLALTSARGVSAMVAFVDLQSGFYAVVRELVLPLGTDPVEVEAVLDSMEIPLWSVDALRALLTEPAALEKHVPDPHLRALLAEAHCHTWFCVEGRAAVARGLKGSRPGTSLADAIFNLAYAPALGEISDGMDGAGLGLPPGVLPQDVPRIFLGPDAEAPLLADATFADDSAFMSVVRRNLEVVEDTRRLFRVICHALLRRGMRMNWKRGKTEVLYQLVGKDSRVARRDFLGSGVDAIDLPELSAKVFVASSYKHLGTRCAAAGAMGPELEERRCALAGALGPLRRAVFRRPGLGDKAKVVLSESLALTKLLFQADAWDPLTEAQLRSVQGHVVGTFRYAFGLKVGSAEQVKEPDAVVMARAGRPDALHRLRVARLRLLPRLLAQGPPQLLLLLDALLALDCGWARLVREDLEWARNFRENGPPLGAAAVNVAGPPGEVPAQLQQQLLDDMALARVGPKTWRALVRRVACRHLATAMEELRCTLWRRELADACRVGAVPALPRAAAAAVAVAAGDQDQAEEAVRRFMCMDCGETFRAQGAWSRHRQRAHGVVHPARRYAYGSCCQHCMVEFHTRPRLVWHLRHVKPRCLDAVRRFFDPLGDEALAEVEARDRADAAALRARGLRWNKAERVSGRVPGPAVPSVLPDDRPEQGVPVLAPPPEEGGAAVALGVPPSSRTVSLQMYFVLHLFAGRRRPGDVQHMVEQALQSRPYPVTVLSIDVATGGSGCDLRERVHVQNWFRLAMAGRVVAIIGGPPRGTWSIARWWPDLPRADRSKPRALRSQQHPWGLLDLTREEQELVDSGNALLRAQVLLMYAALAYGFAALMEHPMDTQLRPHAPSPWQLPELRHLEAQEQVEGVLLDQCAAGAPRRRPTKLLAVRMPGVALRVRQLPGRGRCSPTLSHDHVAPRGGSAGGDWHAVYPRRMCEVIGEAVVDAVAVQLARLEGVRASEVPFESSLATFSCPIDWYDPSSWSGCLSEERSGDGALGPAGGF